MLQWCFLVLSLFFLSPFSQAEHSKVAEVRQNISADLKAQLAAKGLTFGSKVYLRTFKIGRAGGEEIDMQGYEFHKDTGVVEVWMEGDDGKFKLFKTYTTCMFSGHLGPKKREGDFQNPEGFYKVALFNPDSNYHLSMDVGYPNAYDQARGYTGSAIMIHGICKSVGCLAMTNERIEEIYLLAWEASQRGQKTIPIHMFPFRMTNENMKKFSDERYDLFWEKIKPAYDYFEAVRRPPVVKVEDGFYVLYKEGAQEPIKTVPVPAKNLPNPEKKTTAAVKQAE